MIRQPMEHLLKKTTGVPSKKNKGIYWILRFLKFQEEARDPVGRQWRTGSMAGKAKVGMGIGWECPQTVAEIMGQNHEVKKREDDWTIHIFREHNEEAVP